MYVFSTEAAIVLNYILHRPNYIVHVSNNITFFPKYFWSVVGWIRWCGTHGYGGLTVYWFAWWCLFCTGLSLSITSAVAGPAHVFIMTAKKTFNNNHQETLKWYRFITRPRNYTASSQAERTHKPGVPLLLGLRVVA